MRAFRVPAAYSPSPDSAADQQQQQQQQQEEQQPQEQQQQQQHQEEEDSSRCSMGSRKASGGPRGSRLYGKGGPEAPWLAINDFVLSYVRPRAVLDFFSPWKYPCILCFAREDTEQGDAPFLSDFNAVRSDPKPLT